jgi:predicted permease
MLSDLRYRLRALFRRRAMEDELDAELRFHVEQETEKLIQRGLSPTEAARQARLALGGTEGIREECRESRGVHFVETTLQDVRYGLRSLRRSPIFTTAAVLTLTLTIGSFTTTLSLANAELWKALPAERPGELVIVAAHRRTPASWERVSYLDYVQIRDRITTVQSLAAHIGAAAPWWVTFEDRSKELGWTIATANFFSVLGLQPAVGRFFSDDEDRVPDRDHVAVISHDLWLEGWGGSPSAIGATVKLKGLSFNVIGVTPPGFHGIGSEYSHIYLPMMMAREIGIDCAFTDHDCAGAFMIGRRADGRTLADVRAEVGTLAPPRWKESANADRSALELTAYHPRGAFGAYGDVGLNEERRRMFAISAIGLLLGCANLAGLLLARGQSRAREMAIRPSLGATPLRLARQLMTESLLLALAGGALGLIAAWGLTVAFNVIFLEWQDGRHYYLDVRPDAFVIACAASVAVLAGFLFGWLPAVTTIRSGSRYALNRVASSAATPPRITRRLMTAQVAAALALVTLATLLWASSHRFVREARFDASQVAMLRVLPGQGGRPQQQRYPPERAQDFLRTLLTRFESLPGVTSASLWAGTSNSIAGDGDSFMVSVAAGPAAEGSSVRSGWKAVGPRYFDVLRLAILRGRAFDARDSFEAARVAIVNESLARRLWPGRDPLGATLVINKDPAATVVGLVPDAHAPLLGAPAAPQVYVPFWQTKSNGARFCVRTEGDPARVARTLAAVVKQMDPDLPVTEAVSMSSLLVERDLRSVRMTAAMASYGAGLTMLLCAVGLYGTLAFSVARRTRELGIRVAVGAAPRDLVALILKEELTVVLTGVAGGVMLGWMGTRTVGHLLYGTAAHDGLLYAGAALAVTAVGALALWMPARRASRLDPVRALVTE